MSDNYNLDTRLIHESSDYEEGAVNKPIYQSTSFAYDTAEELSQVFKQQAPGFTYTRINNPTVAAFEERLANLEDGVGAIACSSGMAAIATAILSLVEQGDHIVAGNSLFGGTYSLLQKDLPRWGIDSTFIDTSDLESIDSAINDRTRLVYLESLGNPKLDIPDIKAVSKIAHENNIPLLVDNTFLTPYILQVKEWGADIVIHSTSKYINGSANSIGGIIVDLGTFNWQDGDTSGFDDYYQFGPFAYLAKIRQDLFRNLGVCSSPYNASMNITGLETLAVRMDKHCQNALKLAEFLAEHSLPVKINYPGLATHSQHQLARKQLAGKFGGVLTFGLKDQEQCFKFINSLKLARNLANIGDIRTLVIHPASTIYWRLDEDRQRELGVTPSLVRVSVGIENPDDIIKDFSQALDILN
ncbi:MAG: O-acetylhomoserine aminocarboxypropyltransferase/cysteine synthase [Firmicutes bacterium]|nr:O-acetylhomoserine aminocarboxypropyltransferase/cysteine synthase [Bacillota bacterium]